MVHPTITWYLTSNGVHFVNPEASDKDLRDLEFTKVGDSYQSIFEGENGDLVTVKLERVVK